MPRKEAIHEQFSPQRPGFRRCCHLGVAVIILACRIARWLFIAAAWLIALAVVGVVLLARTVALQAPIWSERLGHAMRGRTSLAPMRDRPPAQSCR